MLRSGVRDVRKVGFCAPKLHAVRRRVASAPLAGVRVIDLTRIVAGPFCTQILGDLGADVIKIERPGTGDEARKWGPPFIGSEAPESCYFVALNRNKRSVCVNLKSTDGQKLIYDLSKKSDVLVENYVPGNLDSLNLGYSHLNQISPHLIYCSITGYGSDGPYSSKPGYDVIAASLGGFLHITGPEDGDPVKAGVAVTDIATGLYAHGAIIAALYQRQKTGLGTQIETNLLSTQLASLINIGSNYLNAGKEAKKWGTAHESIVPYESFPTKDGYFTICTGSDQQFKDLCQKMNLGDLYESEDYKTNANRVKNRSKLIPLLKEVFRLISNKEWGLLFENAAFVCGPVNNLKEAFDDPHVKHTGIVEELNHPKVGKIKVVGPPVKYDNASSSIRLPPPTLGQHTDEVLKDLLDYDNDKINQLRQDKVIQ